MPGRNGQEQVVPHATINQIYEKLGEAIAVGREAKHAAHGASQKIDVVAGKVDQLALVVATQGQLRELVARLEEDAKEDRAKIDELEADKLRREGALGLVGWIAHNWPFAFFTVLMGLLVAWANGKVHL
jgi:hypothetical protein